MYSIYTASIYTTPGGENKNKNKNKNEIKSKHNNDCRTRRVKISGSEITSQSLVRDKS